MDTEEIIRHLDNIIKNKKNCISKEQKHAIKLAKKKVKNKDDREVYFEVLRIIIEVIGMGSVYINS